MRIVLIAVVGLALALACSANSPRQIEVVETKIQANEQPSVADDDSYAGARPKPFRKLFERIFKKK